MAGHSSTPLAKKLGIKPESRSGRRVRRKITGNSSHPCRRGAEIVTRASHELDVIHFFTKTRRELASMLPILIPRFERDGTIWISWPKKASKVEIDVGEDLIRTLA